MYLPISRLFWVSSLAYPSLLGTKDYVVVVVVQFGGQKALEREHSVHQVWNL
jgi:hypothetical protein